MCGIEPEVDGRIDDGDDARILTGRLIERGRRRRRQSGMHGRRLAGENPLMKAAEGGSEHGLPVGGQPGREAQARREDSPCIQRSETMDGRSGLVALGIMCGQIRTDRAVVIETQSRDLR